MSTKDGKLFVIAELSANHNNNLDLALETIEAIADAGADAVKIQTYTADSLTLNVDNEHFGPRKDGLWKGKTPYELFTEGSLPFDWHPILKEKAENHNLTFFSSPFDIKGADFLDKLGVDRYKIASPEITDIPLIEHIAKKQKPIIISTGMASLSDIELAVNTCKKVGNRDITLLKCTSEYPATPDMANLNTIPNLKETFGVEVGVSDHTMGSTVPIVAVALGATVIEKHFILSRDLGGIDSGFSMNPSEFKSMVSAVREAKATLGKTSYELSERNKKRRRSIFISTDVIPGDIISAENIRSVRPGVGLHPKYLPQVLGKKFNGEYKAGTPLNWDMLC